MWGEEQGARAHKRYRSKVVGQFARSMGGMWTCSRTMAAARRIEIAIVAVLILAGKPAFDLCRHAVL